MRRRTITIAGLILLLAVTVAAGLWWRTTATPTPTAVTPATHAWDPTNPTYIAKREKITSLLDRAQTTAPTASEAEEMFSFVRDDPAFNVRVRAMAVLPFVQERERAIDVLTAALKVRDPEASGSGNVPLYAATYLADMNATRAIPAIEDWVSFLETQKPYNDEMHSMMLKKGKEDLARLKGGGTAAH